MVPKNVEGGVGRWKDDCVRQWWWLLACMYTTMIRHGPAASFVRGAKGATEASTIVPQARQQQSCWRSAEPDAALCRRRGMAMVGVWTLETVFGRPVGTRTPGLGHCHSQATCRRGEELQWSLASALSAIRPTPCRSKSVTHPSQAGQSSVSGLPAPVAVNPAALLLVSSMPNGTREKFSKSAATAWSSAGARTPLQLEEMEFPSSNVINVKHTLSSNARLSHMGISRVRGCSVQNPQSELMRRTPADGRTATVPLVWIISAERPHAWQRLLQPSVRTYAGADLWLLASTFSRLPYDNSPSTSIALSDAT